MHLIERPDIAPIALRRNTELGSQMCDWTAGPQWFVTLLLTCVKRFLGRDRQQKTF